MHESLIERARHWAIRLWHNYIGCEHLLLVLSEDGALTNVRRDVRRRRA
jgi:Clp amino terminal domain, pathogenicity island component